MQLELFPFEALGDVERKSIYNAIRNRYWYIRNLRRSAIHQGQLRRHYRAVEAQKKRLLLAGVSKRDVLDFLACCRAQCSRYKHPFKPCKHCPAAAVTNFA
ncbi:hypothetical protein [Pseudoduganella sp. R-34]|uniref:hypothetical protein n=1 Tax=Pseudoduganella sp. R-34 TaxID=3404062 RepID=UPI003CE8B61B